MVKKSFDKLLKVVDSCITVLPQKMFVVVFPQQCNCVSATGLFDTILELYKVLFRGILVESVMTLFAERLKNFCCGFFFYNVSSEDADKEMSARV